MAVDKSHTRVGLFLVVALAVVLATALLFVQRMRSREVIELVTYTDQNVSGLDVSSPVRFKGVPLGRVSGVRVAPTGNIVEIDFEVFVDRLTAVGAPVEQVRELADTGVFRSFRAEVVSNPVTGDAYLLVDIPVDPPPAMELAFTPDRAYVPSLPSEFATLQERLPALLDRANSALGALEALITRLPESLDRTDQFFSNVERIIEESSLPELSADLRGSAADARQLHTDLERLIGPQGTLTALVEEARSSIDASELATTAQSAREAFENQSLAADDLRRSLPAMRDSLEQLRELARLFEEQPEAVIFGFRSGDEESR